MRFFTVAEWLNWLKSLHSLEMDLSLERVCAVAERLLLATSSYVITVAGTNGKGSTVAGLEQIYCSAGYKVGVFTSPCLYRLNEQIRINQIDISDDALLVAFNLVDIAREDITLTLYEFQTLAALIIFKNANLDVWLLEVGLGGRFDAVNVIDADIGIITSIDLDHMQWLGDTRDKIALEKAGIYRANKIAICGDLDPPMSLKNFAREHNLAMYYQGQEFGFIKKDNSWDWWSKTKKINNLPLPKLLLMNMATVLMAIEVSQTRLPVNLDVIKSALQNLTLPGRMQVIPATALQPMIILDVSHNPAAVKVLAKYLESLVPAKTVALFSMLSDKDIANTIKNIKSNINQWHCVALPISRGASKLQMVNALSQNDVTNYVFYPTIAAALRAAREFLTPSDRLVVFGSFHTVALSGLIE